MRQRSGVDSGRAGRIGAGKVAAWAAEGFGCLGARWRVGQEGDEVGGRREVEQVRSRGAACVKGAGTEKGRPGELGGGVVLSDGNVGGLECGESDWRTGVGDRLQSAACGPTPNAGCWLAALPWPWPWPWRPRRGRRARPLCRLRVRCGGEFWCCGHRTAAKKHQAPRSSRGATSCSTTGAPR